MISYLVDADTVIYAMADHRSPIVARLSSMHPGEVAISAISFAEIALGVAIGRPPPPNVLEAFIAAVPLVAFDEAAARAYARLPFKRARFDRLLAAHALSIGSIVVTNNPSDFADVPGLRVENWNVT